MIVPPPIQGIGNASGFTMMVEQRDGSDDFAKLARVTRTVLTDAAGQPGLQHVISTFRAGVPQVEVLVDRTKAEALGVSVGDVFATLSGYIGSSYVNQFNEFGRTFQVYAQADAPFRLHMDDILQLTVRSQSGQMVPLGTLVQRAANGRAGADHVVQPVSGRIDRRRPGAGLQLRPGHVDHGGSCRQGTAARHRL